MKRYKMTKRGSKKLFSRTAKKIHKKNLKYQANPMRGGYRL